MIKVPELGLLNTPPTKENICTIYFVRTLLVNPKHILLFEPTVRNSSTCPYFWVLLIHILTSSIFVSISTPTYTIYLFGLNVYNPPFLLHPIGFKGY